jgi:ankyrin repeat protein
MYASTEGRTDVVKLLIASKADVNAKAKNGSTALMMAFLRRPCKIMKMLIAAGADVNAAPKKA